MSRIEDKFPALRTSPYEITSDETREYNGFAFAAGDEEAWWEPPPFGYWPDDVPEEYTLSTFALIYRRLGYEACTSSTHEPSFEKVAIFANALDEPTHAARQLASGLWTSKLGDWEDIEHKLQDLEGDFYGSVALLMRRPIRD